MFNRYLLIITTIVSISSKTTCGQNLDKIFKPTIDTTAYENWPSVDHLAFSGDGKFEAFAESVVAQGIVKNRTISIVSTAHKWKKSFDVDPYASEIKFSNDSKHAIIRTSLDSVYLVKMGSSSIRSFPKVKKVQFCGAYMVMQNSYGHLEILSLITNQITSYRDVLEYQVGNLDDLYVQFKFGTNSVKLVKIDLYKSKARTIYTGSKVDHLYFDSTAERVAFLTGEGKSKILWKYSSDTKWAQKVSLGKNDTLQINQIKEFGMNPYILFVKVRIKNSSIQINEKGYTSSVDVWNYNSNTSPFVQPKSNEAKYYLFAINLLNDKISQIEFDGDRAIYSSYNYVLLQHNTTTISGFYNGSQLMPEEKSWVLCSLIDGRRKKVPLFGYPSASPKGKYLVSYDPFEKNYFSYEVATGIIKNITTNVQAKWDRYDLELSDVVGNSYDLVGWLKNEDGVILQDQNDIWIASLSGSKTAVNLTKGIGIVNDMFFSLCQNSVGKKIIENGQKVLLSSFNRRTKENGFWRLTVKFKPELQKLSEGKYNYFIPISFVDNFGMQPVKAQHSDAYIIQRMDIGHSPNLYFTEDFKAFKRLTDIFPEKNYNWMTSELVNYKTLDGNSNQGVLLKPENFDSKTQYPVIIFYYEKKSNNLNTFYKPDYSSGTIDIPTYVSNGYLVFLPDIHYRIGHPGESAFNAVVSAGKYLKGLPYVDGSHMGIHGHSFGGYQTNYIVANTNLFAAACSTSGVSNLVTQYGQLWDSGDSYQDYLENGQGRMGKPLWSAISEYVKNSPIFNVPSIVTPILLMQNKRDTTMYQQGIAFFTALRRLGKRSWMLQYDNGGHTINGADSRDFTIRMRQFFDHYLKDAPAPVWMTRGISQELKGKQSGLEYDLRIKTPPVFDAIKSINKN